MRSLWKSVAVLAYIVEFDPTSRLATLPRVVRPWPETPNPFFGRVCGPRKLRQIVWRMGSQFHIPFCSLDHSSLFRLVLHAIVHSSSQHAKSSHTVQTEFCRQTFHSHNMDSKKSSPMLNWEAFSAHLAILASFKVEKPCVRMRHIQYSCEQQAPLYYEHVAQHKHVTQLVPVVRT